MTLTTSSCELKALDAINDSSSKFYEQLKVVVDMNDSKSWAQGYRCCKQLNAKVDMNVYESWS